MTPVRAAGVAILLAAVNPKNLTLCLGAGVVIGGADLGAGGTAVALVVFSALASISVAVPVVGHALARTRSEKWLDELRVWLVEHNAAVMTGVLSILGVTMVGKGVGAL